VRRGEVRWYKFSPPDKRRPVLVLTRDAILEYLGDVTVAPVTTTIRDIPSEVRLGKEDGMPRECAVNCDHLQTVSKARLGPSVTALSPAKMREVSLAIAFALGLGT
jgi:mRNA interferase MazF